MATAIICKMIFQDICVNVKLLIIISIRSPRIMFLSIQSNIKEDVCAFGTNHNKMQIHIYSKHSVSHDREAKNFSFFLISAL